MMKETMKKRRPPTSIKALPKELLIEVIARVASHSFGDLLDMKKCCKDFLDAAEDSHVYQHVSLELFEYVWPRNEEESSFLKRCKESKNIETMFREGLLQYVSYPNKEIGGLELLKIVAKKGHKEAKYVYGMIMLCSENEELREEGLEHVRFLRKSRRVIRCRKKVEEIMRYMWKNNKTLQRNKKTICQCKSTCRGLKEGGWPILYDEDDDFNDCEYCRWDQELYFFYQLFNVH